MNNEVYLSSYGEDILDMLSKHQPDPVLLIGDTGWGKTTLLKHYANQNNRSLQVLTSSLSRTLTS